MNSMDILIADPNDISPYLNSLKTVKWIQLTWAGIDKLVTVRHDEPPLKVPITRFGGIFGKHMAEYTIANIIAFERDFYKFHENQKKKFWRPPGKTHYRLMSELTITILGCGDIGKEIAKHCKQFGSTVFGMVNTFRPSDDCIDNYFTSSELSTYLGKSDYICNVLPSTSSTKNLLTSELLSSCNDSVLINIGRGDIVEESILINALEQKWLKGAVLDVFAKEPLPTDSKLWAMDNVHITPHVSGVTISNHVAECFLEQLKLFEEKKPLKYLIDWERGY